MTASLSKPRVVATSRQTRFNPLVQGDASEVDLNDVNISIAEREILVDARVRLKNGIKYGLIGRNGCGKSTVLQAIADKLIPGIPPTLRIHIVSQVAEGGSEDTTESGQRTAVQRVLDGHVERTNALRERAVLEKIIDAQPAEAQVLMDRLMLDKANEELEEKRKIALLRSGGKGWDARKDEIQAEKQLEEAEKRLDNLEIEDDVYKRAADLLSEVQVTLELIDSDDAEAQAIRILRGLGFTEGIMNSPFSDLSGGWQSRCRLATALLVQTDILLLDEPSNFMASTDLKSILWLERFLKESTNYSTLVLTSHDQVFLDRLAEQTIVLRNQQFDYFDGTPSLMYSVEAEERLHKEKMKAALDKKRDHMEASVQVGRQLAKATGDDARMRAVKSREKKLNDRMGLERSAKGTRFKLNRDFGGYSATGKRAEIVVDRVEQEMTWKIPSAAEIKAGGSLVSLEKVTVGYGKGKKAVLEDVSLTVHPGSRLAIVGSNGQGKSTLAKVITGELKPTKGVITTHPSLRIGYFTQHIVESFDASESALSYFMQHFEDLSEKMTEQIARGFLGGLGLQGRTASHVPIGMLSGGQKVRLALAILLYKQPQMLVLDEVTTHLDAYSIRALARGLRNWDGCIVLITHDRWFSSVVVERKAMDEDPDGDPGDTIMVSKGKAKVIEGMKEYEAVVERRLAKRKD